MFAKNTEVASYHFRYIKTLSYNNLTNVFLINKGFRDYRINLYKKLPSNILHTYSLLQKNLLSNGFISNRFKNLKNVLYQKFLKYKFLRSNHTELKFKDTLLKSLHFKFVSYLVSGRQSRVGKSNLQFKMLLYTNNKLRKHLKKKLIACFVKRFKRLTLKKNLKKNRNLSLNHLLKDTNLYLNLKKKQKKNYQYLKSKLSINDLFSSYIDLKSDIKIKFNSPLFKFFKNPPHKKSLKLNLFYKNKTGRYQLIKLNKNITRQSLPTGFLNFRHP